MSKKIFAIVFAAVAVLFSSQLFAQGFTNISKSDYESIAKEVSSNFAHRYISGASGLGSIFGFEFGLILGQGSAKKIKELSQNEVQSLYHGGLAASVTVPFGVTFEGVMLPKITLSGNEADAYSLGVKWTFSEVLLPMIPVNLAVRGAYAGQNLKVKQELAGATGNVSSKTVVTTFDLLASMNFGVFEPYVGVGLLNSKNDTEFSGTGTIFNTTFTTANKVDTSLNGTRFMLGSQIYLGLVTIGAEYYSALDASGVSAKLAFGF